MNGKLRSFLRRIPPLRRAVRRARSLATAARTRSLRRRYPEGTWVECCGVRVFCDFADELYTWYERPSASLRLEQRVLDHLVAASAGNVFLDVGAHFGFFTASFARAAAGRPRARVLAVEPDPANLRCLERTAAACTGVRVEVVATALGAEDGPLSLYRGAAACAHSYAEPGASRIGSVEALCLDSLAARYLADDDKIAVIKLDVDGAEMSLFAGGGETLRRHRPVLFMELAPVHLRAAGVDPRTAFGELCRSYRVDWVRGGEAETRRVGPEDYDEIERAVGPTVTNLVLRPRDSAPEGA